MPHNFFISHYSGDKTTAEIFSNALRRITLEQIIPWFSSDSSQGGLKPGDIWFNQILSKVQESRAVVTLLTPNSINRPWVYFESGIAQALPHCEVIPVCIGVSRDRILPPLGLYQCYQLNDYRSVTEFFSKLLNLFSIKFDEEMSRTILESMVAQISKITFESETISDEPKQGLDLMIQDLKSHLDKRFIQLLDKPTYSIQGDKLNLKVTENQVENPPEASHANAKYSVTFKVDFPGFKNTLFVDIRDGDTVDTVTTSLYFMLSDFVDAFTYLEKWVIKSEKGGKHVVIREISDLIPAKSIFKPGSVWIIEKLKKPYNAQDSKRRVTGNLSIFT